MKRILKAFAVIICMMLCTYAYTQTLTVKFTGRDQTGQHYVKLDHVKTFNLDQLWEEVLYFPDTTLVLGGVGIIDYGNPSNSQLEQNIPNPFNGTTHFTLYLREGADALLEIFDLMGKTVISQYYANLSAGAHLFSANLTNPQVYILKVTVKNEQMHLKLVNNGHGAENSICHVSASFQNGEFESGAKNGQAMGIYPFHNGDELQHTGYTVINGVEYKSETITQRQNESETLILPFNLTRVESRLEQPEPRDPWGWSRHPPRQSVYSPGLTVREAQLEGASCSGGPSGRWGDTPGRQERHVFPSPSPLPSVFLLMVKLRE